MKKNLILFFFFILSSGLFAENVVVSTTTEALVVSLTAENQAKYAQKIDEFFGKYYKDYNYSYKIAGQNGAVSINLYLDEHAFLASDIDFINSLIFMNLGLDRTKDVVNIEMMFFKPRLLAPVVAPQNLAVTGNFNNSFLLIIFCGLFLIMFFVFLLVFVVHNVKMSRRIERLIMENMELAKRNILIDATEDDEVIVEKESSGEISDILKRIDELHKDKKPKPQKSQEKKAVKSQIKISFKDLLSLQDQLFANIIQKYDVKTLAIVLAGADKSFYDKVMKSLNYVKQQELDQEMEKNSSLQILTSEMIFSIQERIVSDVKQMIERGELDSL